MRRALGAAAGTFAFAAVVAGSSITAASASTEQHDRALPVRDHLRVLTDGPALSPGAYSPRVAPST